MPPLLRLCNGLAFANLLPPHRVVQTFLVEQLGMPSKFHDASTLQHVDTVGVHHRGQPMRNQNRDRLLIGCNLANRAADFFFSQRIERRRGFIEHQQLRMPQESASNGKPLFLATRNFNVSKPAGPPS